MTIDISNRRLAVDEATDCLKQVVSGLSHPEHDIILVLRNCVHVCNLLDWDTNKLWFEAELNGYRSDQQPARYRYVVGERYWRPNAAYDVMQNAIEAQFEGKQGNRQEPWQLRSSVRELLQYADKGVYFPVGEEESRWSTRERRDVAGRDVLGISATTLKHVIGRLEDEVFKWASSSYSVVAFGEAMTDFWQRYTRTVDRKLAEIGLGQILSEINARLSADNPEAWRQAALSCRNLLHDVAAYLWQDPRKTYVHLKNEKGEDISVTDREYINRLIAYLHQKGVVGSIGDYLKAEWRRLRRLNDLASSAKDSIDLKDAQSTAVAVYVALGELFERTDGLPVEEYR